MGKSVAYTLNKENATNTFHLSAETRSLELLLSFNVIHLTSTSY